MTKILVTGATGSVGRLLVDELLAAGATDVRALTSNPAKAALPAGVEVVEGFLGRPESVRAALEGVERLYLAPLPRTAVEVMALAREAGVRYVVNMSSSDVEGEKAGDPSGWHYYLVEKAVEESGIPWTHLRPGEFMTNTLGWGDEIRANGEFRSPYPTSANAMIALEDIAAVAARLLLDGGHVGKTYPLTGPETLTRVELLQRISGALSREIPFVALSPEEGRKHLAETFGEWSDWYLDGLRLLAEHPQAVSPHVEDITGRPGTTFAQWVARNIGAFQ
jgi:uncharacterized protein YbjT (DUF2867 family)